MTLGLIAKKLNKPIHSIAYVINSRKIKAYGCAGRLRVFNEKQVEQINDELKKMER